MFIANKQKFDIEVTLRISKDDHDYITEFLIFTTIIICGSIIVYGVFNFYSSHSIQRLLMFLLLPFVSIIFLSELIASVFNGEKILLGIKDKKLFLITKRAEKVFDINKCYFEIYDDGRDRNIVLGEGVFLFRKIVLTSFDKRIYDIAEMIPNKKITKPQQNEV